MAQSHKGNHRSMERMPTMGKTGAAHPSKAPTVKVPAPFKGGKGGGGCK